LTLGCLELHGMLAHSTLQPLSWLIPPRLQPQLLPSWRPQFFLKLYAEEIYALVSDPGYGSSEGIRYLENRPFD
jgi:hypothetical protein